MFRRLEASNIEQVLNLNLHQNFSEKLGTNWFALSEMNMIETRPNRIELKPLTNKYRDNYNHHYVLKFDTAQKLDIIDAI